MKQNNNTAEKVVGMPADNIDTTTMQPYPSLHLSPLSSFGEVRDRRSTSEVPVELTISSASRSDSTNWKELL